MKIVYIHGASATGDSFNYIREHIDHNIVQVLEYFNKNGFEKNLETMKEQQLVAGQELYEITEHELRILTNNRHRVDLKEKNSKRMTEWNTQLGLDWPYLDAQQSKFTLDLYNETMNLNDTYFMMPVPTNV